MRGPRGELTRINFVMASSNILLTVTTNQVIAKLQETEATQRELIRSQKLEIVRLGGDTDDNDSDDPAASPKKKKKLMSENERLSKDALQAGKYFAVSTQLWVSPGALRYLTLLHDDPQENVGDEEVDDDDGAIREEAESIFRALPSSVRPYVREDWFRERVSPFTTLLLHLFNILQFNKGLASIRSQQAHLLATLFPGHIFPELPATQFADKHQRSSLPAVIALLKDKQFLYDRDPSEPKAALDGHLRHPCILQVSHNTQADCSISNLSCDRSCVAYCLGRTL